MEDLQQSLTEETPNSRLDALRKLFRLLGEVNKRVPVIVEGKKDVTALRRLGLEGEIISLHSGKGLYEFSELIHERFDEVILLMDWDDRGEGLMKVLGEYLSGLWERFSPFREMLIRLSNNEVFEVESIPRLMERLRRECETQA